MFAGAKLHGGTRYPSRRRAEPNVINLKKGILLNQRFVKNLKVGNNHGRVKDDLTLLLGEIKIGGLSAQWERNQKEPKQCDQTNHDTFSSTASELSIL